MRLKLLLAAATIGLSCGIIAPANATVVPQSLADTWYVTGTFNDGGTLSGYFTVDVYGYLDPPTNLVTTAGNPSTPYLNGQTYSIPPASSGNLKPPPTNGVYFAEPAYTNILQLTFERPLVGRPGTVDQLVTDPTQSFECYASNGGYCDGNSNNPDPFYGRYFEIGSATATPLPSTWTMLIFGFLGLGFFAYRGSKKERYASASA